MVEDLNYYVLWGVMDLNYYVLWGVVDLNYYVLWGVVEYWIGPEDTHLNDYGVCILVHIETPSIFFFIVGEKVEFSVWHSHVH